MALGSYDSDAKYAVLPLMVVKGQGDDALKLLAAERGLTKTNLTQQGQSVYKAISKNNSLGLKKRRSHLS